MHHVIHSIKQNTTTWFHAVTSPNLKFVNNSLSSSWCPQVLSSISNATIRVAVCIDYERWEDDTTWTSLWVRPPLETTNIFHARKNNQTDPNQISHLCNLSYEEFPYTLCDTQLCKCCFRGISVMDVARTDVPLALPVLRACEYVNNSSQLSDKCCRIMPSQNKMLSS